MRLPTMLMCYFLVSCVPSTYGQPQQKQQAPTNQKVNDAVQAFVDNHTISGAVTLVARHGKIVHLGAVGDADLANQRAMKNNSMFAIASMTKPIVATGLMILVDEGKVSLDDPVSKYIPEFAHAKLKNGDPAERPITLQDVITHTSGLGGSQTFTISLQEEAKALANRPLDFQPGTKWQYSPGLNVVGAVIEIVSGQSLDEYLAERIFTPLKMNNTTFKPTEKQAKRLAVIYQPGDEANSLKPDENFINNPRQPAPNPSGGLYSTARDLFRFYQMILNQGTLRGQRIVSADAVRQMLSLQTGELKTGFTPGNGWGLGWCLVQQPQGVTEMLSAGTFGHGGAFGTQGWVDPQTKTIYVLLIQRTKLPNSDASDVRKAFQTEAARVIN